MGDSFLRFSSHDDPPVAFSFSNPNTSHPRKMHDQQLVPLDPHSRTVLTAPGSHRHAFSISDSNAVILDQPSITSTGSGPLVAAAESSGITNVFKLRANKPHASPKPSTNSLLRQEIFKNAHTLATPHPPHNTLGTLPSLPRAPGPTSTPFKRSNKPNAKPQPKSVGLPSNASPFIEFEPLPLLNKANMGDAGPDQDHPHQSTPVVTQKHRIAATPVIEEDQYAPNGEDAGSDGPTAGISRHSDHPAATLPPKTPSRLSVDRKTPMSGHRPSHDVQSFKMLELEGQLNTANKKVALLEYELDEKEEEATKTQGKMQGLEFQLSNACQDIDGLRSQLDELRQHGTTVKHLHAELVNLRQETRDANEAIEQSQAIYEEKHKQFREVISEYQDNYKQLEDNLTQQRGVSDLLREELSRVRGSYSESLELNSELRSLLNSMSDDQTDMFKSLAELHKQIDDQTVECLGLRTSETSANKHIKSLELNVSSLTEDNARIQNLLTENEGVFAKKLKALEEENKGLSRSLEVARTDLNKVAALLDSLRSKHEDTLAQIEIRRREEHEAKEQVSQLTREVALKTQSLGEACEKGELSSQRLAETEQELVRVGSENAVLQGRIVELEKICSVRVSELKTSQDKLARANDELSISREKVTGTADAYKKLSTVQNALSATEIKIEGQAVEIAHLKQQLAEAKDSYNAYTIERDSLLGEAHASEEREAQRERELQALRNQVEHQQTAIQQSNAQQIEAQGSRRVAEQKLNEQAETIRSIRVKQKVAEDERGRLEAQVMRLESETGIYLSARGALENTISELRAANQQELSARRDLEQKHTIYLDQTSEQKMKINSLEQQITALNTRSVEYKAEANSHRTDAEAARASVALVEYRLKEKELELGNMRSTIQALEAASAESTVAVDRALEARISEQERTIDYLNSTIVNMQRDADSISERYRDGKLAEPERNFITEITTALMQEKNKVVNGLRGEIKRKDNEIVSSKTTISAQKQSMASYIAQIDTLKKQLEELEGGSREGVGQSGLRGTMLEMHQLPSSSLSEAPAPDYDEPAPDTPTVSTKPSKSSAPGNTRQAPLLLAKQKPQQYRAFAEIERNGSSAVDEIQDFEEPGPSGLSGRKRHAAEVEPAEHSEEEQTDNQRKGATKTKRTAKTGGSNAATKDIANARGKTGKRRKA